MCVLKKKLLRIGGVIFACSLILGIIYFNHQVELLRQIIIQNESEISTLKQQKGELENSIAKTELDNLKKSNTELEKTVKNLMTDNDALRQTVRIAVQTGVAKPAKVGITPIFKVTSRSSNDVIFRIRLSELSHGSYQNRLENVSFNINDKEKWKDVGIWHVSRYTATKDECDNNPSMTADSKLVTPGFTVAIDPAFWKYGTIFYFEGLGFGVASDCGGTVKGKNRADFLVASKKFANVLSTSRRVWVVYTPE